MSGKLSTDEVRRIGTSSPAGLSWIASRGTHVSYDHIRYVDRLLLDLSARRITRLAISLPPQHGKTVHVSRAYPAWYLGRNPDQKIIAASYESSFAAEHGRAARSVMEEYGEILFGVKVDPRSSAADRWEIEGRLGGMRTAGMQGGITGKGADVLIIDDPVKGWAEAFSPTYRDRVWNTYTTELLTRLSPTGVVLVVMTRWHEDDLIGRIVKNAKDEGTLDDWTIVRLPALAEEDDPLGREEGEALNPDRYPRSFLKRQRQTMGDFRFASLYQQSPRPAEGGFFKLRDFRYFREIIVDGEPYFSIVRDDAVERVPLRRCMVFQTVDLAASTKDSADFFVIATWALTRSGDLLLLDVYRDRLEGADQKTRFRETYRRFSPSYAGVESVAYQLTFVQDMRREGFAIRKLKADRQSGDKVTRALTIAVLYEAGKVFHREGAQWLGDYESELLHFPRGDKADQVDVAAYAGIEVSSIGKSLGVADKAEGW